MLRIYFLQVWFNLLYQGVEDALYDSVAMRAFVDIDLGREPAPDETTIWKFRHLIEACSPSAPVSQIYGCDLRRVLVSSL